MPTKRFHHSINVRTLIAGFAIAVLVLLTPTLAFAQGTDAQRRAAIANAVEQAGGNGKVLSVKPYKNQEGKPGFRIRILTDGRVRTFDVAADSGR